MSTPALEGNVFKLADEQYARLVGLLSESGSQTSAHGAVEHLIAQEGTI